MITIIKRLRIQLIALSTLFFSLTSIIAHAGLSDDLVILIEEAYTLETQLKSLNADANTLCGPLLEANQAARDLSYQITLIDESLAAPLHLDRDILDSMDELSDISLSLANEALRLSLDMEQLSSSLDGITIKNGLTAMLQLSDDIGTMADRIGEMSDKILIMSDNIGLMADRIIESQTLQSQNFQQTQQFILQSQTNALTLVSVIEDQTFEADFNQIIFEGGLLALSMETVILNPFTLDRQLESVADDVRNLLTYVLQTSYTITSTATNNNFLITAGALAQLVDMSLMLSSLSIAIDGYVIAISGLQAITYKPTLANAMQSMLQLSGDIGIMANRILEMADQILLMSDNIGMQADQILLTQAAMNMNVQTTQTALLAAQEMVINIIDMRNL